MNERLHVVIDGRVQGVGFRYSTYRQALTLGLSGWVRNLEDGRVEADFEGPRVALEQMLEWCRRGPSFSKVLRIEETWSAADDSPGSGFRIIG
ncbi:MAG: acylphosphatase [FCB group bacterium]|nr:acylphosphatase [FCB group bacterium]